MNKYILIVVALVASTATFAQERIDDWYGKEMTELHAALQHDQANYGSKFKFKRYDNDKTSLTMTDYRGVECEYISLDAGWTIAYRVDHYTKKEYKNRKDFISRKWTKLGEFYVLRSAVVAMFNDDEHTIGFTLLTDLSRHGFDPYLEKIDGIRIINK